MYNNKQIFFFIHHLTACIYADMHERNVLGLCATVKKEDR